jgi:hypothetical protein
MLTSPRDLGHVSVNGIIESLSSADCSYSDFADTHPGAEVIGTDISPIQPEWVPPNLKL